MLPCLVAGAQCNESMPYYLPLTAEQHPHALALRHKKQSTLNQHYPTVTPVSARTVAAMCSRSLSVLEIVLSLS